MNNAIDYLRKDLNVVRAEYSEILKKQEDDPLSSDSLDDFPELLKKLDTALAQVREIAYAYKDTLEVCDKNYITTTKHLTPKNRQAIDRLFQMTTEDLLEF